MAVAMGLAACEPPEAFHLFTGGAMASDAGIGSGGSPGTGGNSATGGAAASGGRTGSGGGVTMGGATGSGGLGVTGGRAASGGRANTGGTGAGGTVTGGRGGGGRAGTTGSAGGTGNCITDLQDADYSAGTLACAACFDHGTSIAPKCRSMVDCLAPRWPCSGNCWSECLNMSGGDGVVDTCVRNLTTTACN
jgi:hypothetical protein